MYRADLGLDDTLGRATQHPNNMWSLFGLHECLVARGATAEAVTGAAPARSRQRPRRHPHRRQLLLPPGRAGHRRRRQLLRLDDEDL